MTHVAAYQALKQHRASGTSVDGSAVHAYAAHFVLASSFPNLQSANFDAALNATTFHLNASQRAEAKAIAYPAAIRLIQSRVNDSSADHVLFTPPPQLKGPVGAYQYTPATLNAKTQTFALYPQFANLTTFVIGPAAAYRAKLGDRFRPAAPASANGLSNVGAVFQYGNRTAPERSAYDSATPGFWEAGPKTSNFSGYFFAILAGLLPSNTTLFDASRVFAQLAVAQLDSNVVGWYLKYDTLFWRPVTAIRQGYPGRDADPSWTPAIATPAHPEYPSTHSVNAGASAQIIRRYFGTDNITVTFAPDAVNNVTYAPRTYANLTALEDETAISRFYGGVHFQQSGPDGLAIGRRVADEVFDSLDAKLDSGADGSKAASLGLVQRR
ncbi:hypothetical protein WJX81_003537 [Elliptochloris bilobata]|uniref:Vanadium-dependent haloperoxidase NapH1-like second helical-bundle domain-containing protein n=1 Tax=Elliptochloris bilobata TaxID=381761 RepID=A0AAW1RLU5_9CHLO